VPPETAFTPPKGADWDDVVLPAVAKKLALAGRDGGSGDEVTGTGTPSDDDLAVEWDKDGTPIRWQKRATASRQGMSGMDFSVSRDDDKYGYADYDEGVDDFGPGYGYDSIYDEYDQRDGDRGAGTQQQRPIELRPVRTSTSAPTKLEEPRQSLAMSQSQQHQTQPYSPTHQQPYSPHQAQAQSPPPRPARHNVNNEKQFPAVYSNDDYAYEPRPSHTQPRPAPQPPTFPPAPQQKQQHPQQMQHSIQTKVSQQPQKGGKGNKRLGHDADDIKSSSCACVIM
jgi:hypothetical protein